MYMHFVGLIFLVHGCKEKGACKCVSVEVGMHAPHTPFPTHLFHAPRHLFHTPEVITILAHNDLDMKFH
jgi:hypothetical protein